MDGWGYAAEGNELFALHVADHVQRRGGGIAESRLLWPVGDGGNHVHKY